MVSERKFIEQIRDNYVKLRLAIALAYHCSFVDFDYFHCPHLYVALDKRIC